MILLTHIIIACASLVVTTLTCISPSSLKLRMSYVLIALTIISGTYLTVSQPAHLTQTCETGLIYLAVAGFGTLFARRKLKTLIQNRNIAHEN